MSVRAESRRLLFVVTEIGAARFMEPLWRRWLGRPTDFEWKVVAADDAMDYLRRVGLAADLPNVRPARRSDQDLAGGLSKWVPTAIVASAGDHYPIEAAAVGLARELAVPSAQFVDTWYNYARRFAHSGGPVYPDYILVIDDLACREADAEGLPSDRIVAVGQPAWEYSAPLDGASLSHVLFLGAPVRRDYGLGLGFDESSVWRVVVEAAELYPERFRQLMYAAHPAQAVLTDADVAPAVLVRDSMAALQRAGVVLGIFSSPMIDAYLGGRLVISVQPNLQSRDLCPLSRHGRIARVGDARSLVEALDAPLTDPADFGRSLAGSTDRLEAWLLRISDTVRSESRGRAFVAN